MHSYATSQASGVHFNDQKHRTLEVWVALPLAYTSLQSGCITACANCDIEAGRLPSCLAVLKAGAGVVLLGEAAAEGQSKSGVCFAQSFVPSVRGCVADAHCGYGIIPSDSSQQGCEGIEGRLCTGMAPGVQSGSGCGLRAEMQLSSGKQPMLRDVKGHVSTASCKPTTLGRRRVGLQVTANLHCGQFHIVTGSLAVL